MSRSNVGQLGAARTSLLQVAIISRADGGASFVIRCFHLKLRDFRLVVVHHWHPLLLILLVGPCFICLGISCALVGTLPVMSARLESHVISGSVAKVTCTVVNFEGLWRVDSPRH